MIENFNASKNASSENYVDVKKYIGVASVNVLAVNPTNALLRQYGWQIPEDADEPKYVTVNNDGKPSARVRFLVQIQDMDEKPVVAMDFWIRPDVYFNNDMTKCQIIDAYGRTAWASKTEVQKHEIPMLSTGSRANINSDYKPSHRGQAEIVAFLMKYLNVTPLQIFNKDKNEWVPTKNPGRLTIDNWGALCNGNVSEIKEYVSLQPDNRVKVIFGIRTTEDNKTYQSVLIGDSKSGAFIGNGVRLDITTGEYASARKAIEKARNWYDENNKEYPYTYSAAPVKEWKQTATEVEDNSTVEDMPDFGSPEYTSYDESDLPFK